VTSIHPKLENPKLIRSSTTKSLSTIQVNLLVLGKQIGNGKSSSVFSSSHGSRKFAVKIVSKEYKKYAKNEAEILEKLSDKNIVKFFKRFERPEKSWLVFELIEGKDLFSLMRKGCLRLAFIQNITRQIVHALQKVHSAGVVYRDLKPENIMVQNDGTVKLVDFGLAKVILQGRTKTICGSALYMAPEVIRGEFYDFSIDYWSLGVLIFECFAGKTPFEGSTIKEISQNVISGNIQFDEVQDLEGRDFVQKLLCREPQLRLGYKNEKAFDIWDHKFLCTEENDIFRCINLN
jgi:serine/threonine protein kinase